MKRKALVLCLALEAAALLALTALSNLLPAVFTAAAAFPFEQVGLLLAKLSAHGGAWNGLAAALLVLIAALPLIAVLRHVKERERLWEHLALLALSLLLLCLIPRMAQPRPQSGVDLGQPLEVDRAVMGLTIYACIVCWGVLRLLRLFRAADMGQLYGYLRAMLCALCALFVGVIVLVPVKALIEALSGAEGALDVLLSVIKCVCDALPYALDIVVMFAALAMLERLLAGEREAAREAASRLSRRCCAALGLDVAVSAGWNVLQLALARHTNSVSVSVSIPLVSLALVLLALLLSRLVAENGRLADENEAFI